MTARIPLAGVIAAVLLGGACAASAAPIPFTAIDARPFVTVTLNGRPFRFLVDTGDSGRNGLSARTATALRLNVRSAAPISGANAGRLAASEAVVDRFTFGPVTLRRATFTVADYARLERRIGFRLDGIVGGATLAGHRVRFDGPHRTIEVDPRDPLPATAVPVRVADGWPVVDATVDGVRGTFLIDTGDRSYLTLFTPFARAHYAAGHRPLRGVVTGFGLVAPIVTDLTRTRLSVAGVVTPSLVTRLATQTSGGFAASDLAGSIGFAALLDDVVDIDYVRRRFAIARRGAAPRSEWDRAGMWLSRASSADIDVSYVMPRGPAARAGLRTGDRLVAVDGRDAAAVDLPALRARLASAHPGVLRVTRRRDGHDTVVVVQPRALL